MVKEYNNLIIFAEISSKSTLCLISSSHYDPLSKHGCNVLPSFLDENTIELKNPRRYVALISQAAVWCFFNNHVLNKSSKILTWTARFVPRHSKKQVLNRHSSKPGQSSLLSSHLFLYTSLLHSPFFKSLLSPG